MFEAGLMEYLRFETGRVPWRMGRGPVSFGVVEQRAAPSLSCQSHEERRSTNSRHAVVLFRCQAFGSIVGAFVEELSVIRTRLELQYCGS
jgi:hypothetical protein